MTQNRVWPPRRGSIAAAVVPVLLFLQMLAFGANGPLLGVAAATLDIAVAIIVLLLLAPDAKFWAGAWPPILLVAAALAWIALPGIAPGFIPGAVRPAPDLLWPGMTRLFGGVALLLAGAWVGYRRGMMRTAIRWITALGVLNIAVGLALRSYDPTRVWGVEKSILGDRFTGTLLNANSSACFFGVLAILALGGFLAQLRDTSVVAPRRSDHIQMVLYALTILGGVGACAITGSRMALLLGSFVLITMLATDDRIRWIVLSWRGLIALLVATVAVVLLGTSVGDLTLDRMSVLADNGNDRILIWRHYGALAQQSLLTGYGPLAFDEVNVRHIDSLADAELLAYVHSPHNAILSLLFAGGAPYAGLLVLAGCAILRQIARRRRTERQDPVLRAAMWSSLFIAGCAMVDIQLDVPAMSGLAIFLLALPWGRAIRIAADDRAARARPQP